MPTRCPQNQGNFSIQSDDGNLYLALSKTKCNIFGSKCCRGTIYTAIYAIPRGELRTAVIGWLRFGHASGVPGREAKTGGDGFPTWPTFMTGRLKLKNG